MLAFKLTFVVGLLMVLAAGIVVFRNFDAWFGADLNVPSETEGSLFLNKSQVVLVWILAMKLMAMMIFVL